MIQKGKARCVDSANTVCMQEYHVHLNVDDLRVLPADFLSPRLHHFHASMVCALVTHQIWTNGYHAHHRLCVYAQWFHTCILQVMYIEPSTGCLSWSHSRAFPPLVYKAQTSWWSCQNHETKKQISWRRQLFRNNAQKNLSVTSVLGLPIRDSARGSNNCVHTHAQMSAIDVTKKILFERLYLVPGMGTFGPWVNFP